jgi:hypothetical protein
MSKQQPYSVQLDPDTARRMATHGATILLLDVPLGMPIGVDQQVRHVQQSAGSLWPAAVSVLL